MVEKLKRFRSSTLVLLIMLVIAVGTLAAGAIDRHSRRSPEFCASCHIMEDHVDSYLNGSNMDAVHREAKVGCKDCHADYSMAAEMKSMVNYATGNYEEVFSRRRFAEEMCLKCHISNDYQATKTDFLRRNPHRGHWPHLRCTYCHLSHAKQVDFCGRCHENGGQRMTGEEHLPRTHNTWAPDKPETSHSEEMTDET